MERTSQLENVRKVYNSLCKKLRSQNQIIMIKNTNLGEQNKRIKLLYSAKHSSKFQRILDVFLKCKVATKV